MVLGCDPASQRNEPIPNAMSVISLGLRRQGLIFGLETTDLLLVFLVPFVAFWTARLALARGRNPWIWGGGALVLGIPWPGIDLPILGVVPVLFLMFFVKPSGQVSRRERNSCSRCASPHAQGQNYCTKCGWDLSREYSPEGSDTMLASEMIQSQNSSTATLELPSEQPASEAPTQQVVPTPEPSTMPEPTGEVPGDITGKSVAETTPEQVSTATPGEESEQTDQTGDPTVRPWGIPQPSPAPTAEGMTARGAALLSEGKLQEAIDQFTKAIALDSQHREAFERRAEAYTRQGRGERAQEDYRSIQALNASS